MITFPSNLPKPQKRYSADITANIAVTEFETSIRQRRRYSDPLESIGVEWELSQLQMDLFAYFVETVLESGSLPFEVMVAGLDGLEVREVIIDGGKFSKTYKPFNRWVVSCRLVAQRASYISQEMFETLTIPALSEPDLFLLSAEALELYLIEFFGNAFGSETINRLLKLYP